MGSGAVGDGAAVVRRTQPLAVQDRKKKHLGLTGLREPAEAADELEGLGSLKLFMRDLHV